MSKELSKYTFIGKSDQYFTEGEVYEIRRFPDRYQVDSDDEGDHHGLSKGQLKRWFSPVTETK